VLRQHRATFRDDGRADYDLDTRALTLVDWNGRIWLPAQQVAGA